MHKNPIKFLCKSITLHIIKMTKLNGFFFTRIWPAIFFSVLFFSTGHAQNNNSPYSIHAIGDITDNIINRTSGMASTGIAYRNNRYLITNNPAALSALDNQFFAGEIGVNGQYIDYSGDPVSQTNHQSSDITFKRFTLGTKIFRHWGSAVGLVPFSEENYEYSGTRPIGYNGGTLPTYDQGYGGINKVFWANGYEFFHHLSVGITTSYLFGSINNKNIVLGQGTSVYLSKNNSTFYNNLYVDYGLQYYGSVNAHWDFALGAVFANQTALNTETNINVLNLDSNVLRNTQSFGTYNIPVSYGLGLSITKDKKYTFLADYKFQNWSDLTTSTGDFFYKNSQRASVGFEISKKKIAYNTLYETNFFQAGFYYNKTYLIVNGTPIDDIGGSVGMGVNSRRTPLSFMVVLQYGIKGTTQNNLLRENYVNLSFIFSVREFWYTQGRKFD
jgi:hypothetical protein